MPESITTPNLVRAAVAALIVAGGTTCAVLGALGVAEQGVNWVGVGAAFGGSFFSTMGAILGIGPKVTG